MDSIAKQPGRLSNGGGELRFFEDFRGFFSSQNDETRREQWQRPPIAYRRGKHDRSRFAMGLDVHAADAGAFLKGEAATIKGAIVAGEISPQTAVTGLGQLQVFIPDPTRRETFLMTYELPFATAEGREYFLVGRKFMHNDPGFDCWFDTTTVHFLVFEGAQAGGRLFGAGMARLGVRGLVRQFASMKVGSGWNSGLRKIWFGVRFLGKVAKVYGRPLTDITHRSEPHPVLVGRPLKLPACQVFHPVTRDGVELRLRRYQGGPKGPVILAPGFGVAAISFAANTVAQNLPEYLAERGYDVWLFDYRASPDLSADQNFTVDDIALEDWPTAVDFVRQHAGVKDVQLIGHCVGSMTLLMGLLSGRLQGVRSAICSQLGVYPVSWWFNHVKVYLRPAKIGLAVGLKSIDMRPAQHIFGRLLSLFFHTFPIPPGESCQNPVCWRVFGVFGPSYRHANLNEATHNAIGQWFGKTSVRGFSQISTMVRRRRMLDRHGHDTYLIPENMNRVALPILFLSGDKNHEFYPRGTEKTFLLLRKHNGIRWYERLVIPDYSHMDLFIGHNASRDVFAKLTDYLDKTQEAVAAEAT